MSEEQQPLLEAVWAHYAKGEDDEAFRLIDTAVDEACGRRDVQQIVELAMHATALCRLPGTDTDWDRAVPYYKLILQWDP